MISDSALKSKVKVELGVRDLLDRDHVEVKVQDGKVILDGEVMSSHTSDAIAKACWTVEGVSSVDNKLKVGS